MASSSRSFGVELEFKGISLDYLNEALLKARIIPFRYVLNHKAYEPKYDNWYLDYDKSVSEVLDNSDYIGGELSSRILYDCDDDWFEIMNLVDFLNELGAYSNDYCGLHLTYCVNEEIKKKEFLKTLCKVLSVYETDINLFYMGDKFSVRAEKDIYAKSIGLKAGEVLDSIDRMETVSHKNLYSFIRNKKMFTFTDGINLQKYGLMEIRYPNGTLDFDTIHNDGDFSLSLINAIANGKFNQEYLDYVIDNAKDDSFKNKFLIGDDLKFSELVDIIEDDSDKKNRYVRQYSRVINSKRSN